MSRLSAFLSGVTATATAFIAISLLTGAKAPPTKFEEIDVGRINVREPDGTLRLVISNRAQFPGAPWKGGEVPRPDRQQFAGMLFVNDEGTENGGLIQKGVIGPDGKADAGLSLSFDRFRQDQVLQLLHFEKGGQVRTMVAINDEPPHERIDVMARSERLKAIEALPEAQRAAAYQEMSQQGLMTVNRARLFTSGSRASVLSLSDEQGRPRLRLMVTASGQPSIEFLDDKGKVAKTIALDPS